MYFNLFFLFPFFHVESNAAKEIKKKREEFFNEKGEIIRTTSGFLYICFGCRSLEWLKWYFTEL